MLFQLAVYAQADTFPSEEKAKTNAMNKFRNNGAKGALLDEYERAIVELQKVISKVTPDELVAVVDHETKDQNCDSIQSILAHVIGAGYNYARAIRKSLNH